MKLSKLAVLTLCCSFLLIACTSKAEQKPGDAAIAENSAVPETNASSESAQTETNSIEVDKEDAGRVAYEFTMSYWKLTDITTSLNNTLDFSKLTDLEREELGGCAPEIVGTYTIITLNDNGNTSNMLMFFYMDGDTERVRIVSRYKSAEECEKAARVMLPLFSEQIKESDIDTLVKDGFFSSSSLSKKAFADTSVGVKKMINFVCWADAPRDALAFIE